MSLKPSSSSSSAPESGKSGESAIGYVAERVVGNGSFGVVYQASVVATGETVAIKKVLQDSRFKNRELEILQKLEHPCVVQLLHCFYSRDDGKKSDDIYLNLVMEYIPETVYKTLKSHSQARKLLPLCYVQVYMFQIVRALGYIHRRGICHRDIKPQNLLLDPVTHTSKLCDFGSAKVLVSGEPNVAYICSRYYRAPELIFESTDYTTAVDIWSLGCVFAEMLLGAPLFPGDSGVDQLIEIIKILGTPSKRQIQAMNPNHVSFKFAQIEPHAWSRVFRNRAPPEALALVDSLLQYDPADRISAMEALASPFFDSLRRGDARLPNGKPLPPLFDFTQEEMKEMKVLGITARVVPDAHPLSTAKSTHSHSHRGEQEQALGVHMDVSP